MIGVRPCVYTRAWCPRGTAFVTLRNYDDFSSLRAPYHAGWPFKVFWFLPLSFTHVFPESRDFPSPGICRETGENRAKVALFSMLIAMVGPLSHEFSHRAKNRAKASHLCRESRCYGPCLRSCFVLVFRDISHKSRSQITTARPFSPVCLAVTQIETSAAILSRIAMVRAGFRPESVSVVCQSRPPRLGIATRTAAHVGSIPHRIAGLCLSRGMSLGFLWLSMRMRHILFVVNTCQHARATARCVVVNTPERQLSVGAARCRAGESLSFWRIDNQRTVCGAFHEHKSQAVFLTYQHAH